MLSSNIHGDLTNGDLPVMKIPGMCIGGLTSAPGDMAFKHCRQNKRGTRRIKIRPNQHSKPFLEI